MGEFQSESLVPREPLPWRAAAPAWRASLQNQPPALSVPRCRPHLHEPTIFASATWAPSKHFSSPALLQFRSLIPIANWPPEYSQPKTAEFSNYRFVPLRVEQHTVCSSRHARHTLSSVRIVAACFTLRWRLTRRQSATWKCLIAKAAPCRLVRRRAFRRLPRPLLSKSEISDGEIKMKT